MRSYLWLVVVSLLALSGCTTLKDSIGAAALTIDTLAESAADECANPTPQHGCVEDSAITTAEAIFVRQQLQVGQDALVDANTALNAGDKASAGNWLEQAQSVIDAVKRILTSRGVQ